MNGWYGWLYLFFNCSASYQMHMSTPVQTMDQDIHTHEKALYT